MARFKLKHGRHSSFDPDSAPHHLTGLPQGDKTYSEGDEFETFSESEAETLRKDPGKFEEIGAVEEGHPMEPAVGGLGEHVFASKPPPTEKKPTATKGITPENKPTVKKGGK